jgi:hypothetical protein
VVARSDAVWRRRWCAGHRCPREPQQAPRPYDHLARFPRSVPGPGRGRGQAATRWRSEVRSSHWPCSCGPAKFLVLDLRSWLAPVASSYFNFFSNKIQPKSQNRASAELRRVAISWLF